MRAYFVILDGTTLASVPVCRTLAPPLFFRQRHHPVWLPPHSWGAAPFSLCMFGQQLRVYCQKGNLEETQEESLLGQAHFLSKVQKRVFFTLGVSGSAFLASQDTLEVMRVTYLLTYLLSDC